MVNRKKDARSLTLNGNPNILNIREVIEAFSVVSKLYPYTPSLALWRSWEYAAYKRFSLMEPVLDIGCGDGRYFKLVWPEISNVVGIDVDLNAIKAAETTGIYSSLHNVSTNHMSFESASFASAFANCSLEHMDNLPEVLNNIHRILKPGGTLLMSVVTDKFLEWSVLPSLVGTICGPKKANAVKKEYLSFHHLVSALKPAEWVKEMESAGFQSFTHVPIVPEFIGQFFMFIDNLWNLNTSDGRLGPSLTAYLKSLNRFPSAFGNIIEGILQAERQWEVCCGAVFRAFKK